MKGTREAPKKKRKGSGREKVGAVAKQALPAIVAGALTVGSITVGQQLATKLAKRDLGRAGRVGVGVVVSLAQWFAARKIKSLRKYSKAVAAGGLTTTAVLGSADVIAEQAAKLGNKVAGALPGGETPSETPDGSKGVSRGLMGSRGIFRAVMN